MITVKVNEPKKEELRATQLTPGKTYRDDNGELVLCVTDPCAASGRRIVFLVHPFLSYAAGYADLYERRYTPVSLTVTLET